MSFPANIKPNMIIAFSCPEWEKEEEGGGNQWHWVTKRCTNSKILYIYIHVSSGEEAWVAGVDIPKI